jgi:hypothetical protein
MISMRGRRGELGASKQFVRARPKRLAPRARRGPRSSAPGSKIRAGLGWYYRGKYTSAEREVGDGPDRWHFVLLPCRFEGRVSLLLLSYRVWGGSGRSGKAR